MAIFLKICDGCRERDTKISGHNESVKEQLDNQQNAETQRERYYATIHKVSLQSGEKIPGRYF